MSNHPTTTETIFLIYRWRGGGEPAAEPLAQGHAGRSAEREHLWYPRYLRRRSPAGPLLRLPRHTPALSSPQPGRSAPRRPRSPVGAPAARWAPPVRPPPVPAPAEASPAAGPADRPLAPAASRSPDEAALLRMNIQWFKYSWRCWAAPAQWKKSSPGPAPPERTAPAAPGPAAAAFTPEPGPRIEGLQLLCLHKNPSRCTPNR